jgi:hypothetical protein
MPTSRQHITMEIRSQVKKNVPACIIYELCRISTQLFLVHECNSNNCLCSHNSSTEYTTCVLNFLSCFISVLNPLKCS